MVDKTVDDEFAAWATSQTPDSVKTETPKSTEEPILKQPNEKDVEAEFDAWASQQAAPVPVVEEEKPDLYSTIAVNFAEGVTGGFSGEIAGGVSALGALIDEDHSFADVASIYRKNRDALDSVRIRGNKEFPVAGFISEAVGGTGLAFASAGAGLAINSVKGAAALGAVTGFGKGEGVDVGSIASGAVMGGATQGVLNKIFGTGPATTTLGKISKGEQDAVLQGLNIKSAGEFTTGSTEKFATGILAKRGAQKIAGEAGEQGVTQAQVIAKDYLAPEGMDVFQLAKEVIDVPGTNERLFMPNDTYPVVLDRVRRGISYIKDNISETISQPDLLLVQSGDHGVNANSIYQNTIELLKDLKGNDAKNAALRVVKKLTTKPYVSLNDANMIRTELSAAVDLTKTAVNNAEQIAYRVNKIIRDEMTSTMKRVVGKEGVDQFNAASRAYGNFQLVEKLLQAPAQSANLGAIGQVQGKIMNAMRKFSASYALNQKAGMVNATVEGLKAAVKNPTSAISGKRLASLAKITKTLEADPARWQEQGVRLLQASTRTAEFFQQELGYVESLIDLTGSPVERNTNDLVMKLPQILNIINDQAPDQAKNLLKAVQSGNEMEIGAIMSDLGRMKEAQGLIARGVGWGGKAATSMDIQEWESQIKNSGQNHTLRMRQLEALRKSGTGPVFEQKVDYIKQTAAAKRNKNGKKVGAY
ncbi:MAG TPA: hypothetical protein VIS27_09550 [Yeosuana sp.]